MKEKKIYFYTISYSDFIAEKYDLEGHELEYITTTRKDIGAIHEYENITTSIPRVPVRAMDFKDGRTLWITVYTGEVKGIEYTIEMPEGWTPEE